MDISALSKLTVPVLKKELKDRGLPLGGVKADLVQRLHSAITQQQQQQEQLYSLQSNQYFQLPLLTTNINAPTPPLTTTTTTTSSASPATFIPPLPPRPTTTKVMELFLGYVDPRDKFGGLVSGTKGQGSEEHLRHEGFDWGFYCTKSMDYQIWTTVYLKCLKRFKEGDVKKRVLDETIPAVEATVEFPSGKKVKGVLNGQNGHRLFVIKDAHQASLTKIFGAKEQEHITNVKVTLRTLSEPEARQAEHTVVNKKQKTEKEDELGPDWGVYGQMDSDDENRSDYDTNSDYSSESEPD